MWIVYDKNENIQDKLTTVYSGISFLRNCDILMLINAKKDIRRRCYPGADRTG